jgi:diguanylate cyclase (GGDEF)-like protein/PAS domain S-box-containing protein
LIEENALNLHFFSWRSLKTRVTLLTLALFFASILVLALLASRMLRQDMQRVLGEQQFAAVSGFAREIDDSLHDRMQALETIAKELSPAMPSGAANLQALLQQSPLLLQLFNGGVFIAGSDGTAVADVPLAAGRVGINYLDREAVSIPLKEGRTVIGRPALGKKLGAPVFSIAAPIFDARGKVIGVLVGTVNLDRPSFLDRLAQTRYGMSGSYLLIAPQHGLFVTSTDKRLNMQPLPAPGLNTLHDRVMQGFEGFGLTVSSSGVPELAAAKRIPTSGWIVVATLPTHEAFAPVDDLLQRLLLATLAALGLAGALTWWLMGRLLQSQLAPVLAARRALGTLAASDQPVQALPVTRQDEIGELIAGFNLLLASNEQREARLKSSEHFKDAILDTLHAEIAVVDRQGLILTVNARWQQFASDNSAQPGTPASGTGVGSNYLEVCRAAADLGTGSALAAYDGLRALLDGLVPSFQLEYPCDSPGQQRWFSMTAMPLGRDARNGAVIAHTDISRRKSNEAVDAFLAQAGSIPNGEPFFSAMARFLAASLGMDQVCIDRLEGDQQHATHLALWRDGEFQDKLTYALRGTPCGGVLGQEVCCFPARVCQLFPGDLALQALRAESYIGVTLWSHDHRPIGLIAVIGRQPLQDRTRTEAVLERIAMRAAGELERLQGEMALQSSESHLRAIIAAEPECIKIVDAQGRLTQMNPAGLAMIEADSLEQVAGQAVQELLAPEYRAAFAALHQRVLAGESLQLEFELVGLKGGRRWMETNAAPMRVNGQPAQLAVTRDISLRKRSEAQLTLAASVFSHAREAIMITDAQGIIIDVNESFTRITGYGRDEACGQSPRILKSGRQDQHFYAAMWRSLVDHGHWTGEVWNRRKNGEVFAELQTVSAVRDASGMTQQYVSLFSDISAIKAQQGRLEHLAHFDVLTDLPNRVLLSDRMKQAMAQVRRRDRQLAVIYLDLDGFKAVNDRHGHELGDQVLVALTQRMKMELREGDTLARLGGDEFVAVLSDLTSTTDCLPLVNRLLVAAAQSLQVGDVSVQVSASAGVTLYPQGQEVEADQLLRQADLAMYQAKVAGKNRYQIFDTAQDSHLRSHHESLEHIQRALAQGELVLHYQPKVNMRTGRVVGAEALIRWQHPTRGLLAPADFLPTIEDHPLAVAVGEWVIETALSQVERWHGDGLTLPVSVNVGARQLQQGDFVERLQSLLALHPRVNPASLELEVLETSALADMAQVSQVIRDCAAFGVLLALDDFGTGYSSLTYLKRLRVSLLKIDQSFVRDMLDDPDDLAILQGVISLAAAFRCTVIAEGVETVAHGTALLRLGCELAQGYGIARPMPAQQMPAWAATWRPDPAWSELQTA